MGLIIDIQERLFPFIDDHERLARNTAILIEGLKILNVPLLVTEQYTKGLGPMIEPLQKVLHHITPIEKIAFSCCDEPAFMEALNAHYRKFVIMAGIETHVCVLQTAVDLLTLGFTPVVVEDCVSSRKAGDRQAALARMRMEGAILTTVESILFELTRVSRSDEFKAISTLVK
jgi:isochorismate hydrolase